MKLNDAVAKVYAFLNKISQNKLFKNQTNATQTNETNLTETNLTESNATENNATQAHATEAKSAESNQKSKQKTNRKSKLRRIVEPIAFVLAGILCFSYPVVSTLWNNRVSKEISNAYDKYNHDQAGDVRRAHIRAAKLYNKSRKNMLTTDPYGPDGQKDVTNTPEYKRYLKALEEPMGIIGIVKIPKIGVKLPIYHGS